eukprot:2910861-Pleurochrysis_carterae.AAC.2
MRTAAFAKAAAMISTITSEAGSSAASAGRYSRACWNSLGVCFRTPMAPARLPIHFLGPE